MKKTLLFLCAAAICGSANAQVSVGPVVGVNFTQFVFKMSNQRMFKDVVKKQLDYRAGIVANIPLDGKLDLQPGVIYSTNSYYFNDLTNGSALTVHIHAIEIPVNITFKTKDKHNDFFFVSAGPYIVVNTAEKGIAENTYLPAPTNYSSKIGTNYLRYGMGIGMNAGYQMRNGFFVRAHFQRLLTTLSVAPFTTTSYNFGASIGYLFKTRAKRNRKQPDNTLPPAAESK